MYKEKAVSFCGSKVNLAKMLEISPSSISQWGELIPEKQAMKLALLTDGALKYDSELYK